VLEIHPHDAEVRGIGTGDGVLLSSRKGAITLHAKVTERVPAGVCYTTFHHPEAAANVITTEFSDWATNCPEYKVTAVQLVRVAQTAKASDWQKDFAQFTAEQERLLAQAKEASLLA
jgi:formate dehydrogenase major subunit